MYTLTSLQNHTNYANCEAVNTELSYHYVTELFPSCRAKDCLMSYIVRLVKAALEMLAQSVVVNLTHYEFHILKYVQMVW